MEMGVAIERRAATAFGKMGTVYIFPSAAADARPGLAAKKYILSPITSYSTSNSPAAPMPPPTHIVTTT